MKKRNQKNTKPEEELDYFVNEAGEIVLAKPDDYEDDPGDNGTVHD